MTQVPATSHGSGPSAVLASTPRTLTNAEILALPSTPIELIPAPGPGKIIVALRAFLVSDFAVAYSGIDVAADYPAIVMLLGTPHAGAAASGLSQLIDEPDTPQNGLTNFLTFTFFKAVWGVLPELDEFATAAAKFETVRNVNAAGADQHLVLSSVNSADFTDGDPANTLTVIVHYTLLDV